MADFIDVSKEPNRNSIVWDYFYLNKAKEVAKCMVCAEKNVVKSGLVFLKSLYKVHGS